MATLSQRDQRTLRIGAAAIVLYLALFFGLRLWRNLESRRAAYEQLIVDSQRLKRDLQPYENRALLTEKLKETYHLNPAKLSRASVVAEASAAIQKAAAGGQVVLGPIRESAARPSAKELASMQLEGVGPAPAITALLHRLEVLGFPLVIDSIQINAEPAKPGMVKISLIIAILDFEQWKTAELPHA
jgi:hypothetical protein